MRTATIVLCCFALCSCATRAEKQTNTVGHTKGRLVLPLPATGSNGGVVFKPQTVTFDIIEEEQYDEQLVSRSGLDKEEVVALVDATVKAAISAAPGGSAMNDLLGMALGGVGVLAGGGAALRARKTGAAMVDAVAAARDALAALPSEQAEAIKDKHRERQKRRGTNDLIKSQL